MKIRAVFPESVSAIILYRKIIDSMIRLFRKEKKIFYCVVKLATAL
jgi:hypothetical protein